MTPTRSALGSPVEERRIACFARREPRRLDVLGAHRTGHVDDEHDASRARWPPSNITVGRANATQSSRERGEQQHGGHVTQPGAPPPGDRGEHVEIRVPDGVPRRAAAAAASTRAPRAGRGRGRAGGAAPRSSSRHPRAERMELELDAHAPRHGAERPWRPPSPSYRPCSAARAPREERRPGLVLGRNATACREPSRRVPAGQRADRADGRTGRERALDDTAVERLRGHERGRASDRGLTPRARRPRSGCSRRTAGSRRPPGAARVERREEHARDRSSRPATGLAGLAAEPDVDRAVADARVGAGDDVPAQRAAQLPDRRRVARPSAPGSRPTGRPPAGTPAGPCIRPPRGASPAPSAARERSAASDDRVARLTTPSGTRTTRGRHRRAGERRHPPRTPRSSRRACSSTASRVPSSR